MASEGRPGQQPDLDGHESDFRHERQHLGLTTAPGTAPIGAEPGHRPGHDAGATHN